MKTPFSDDILRRFRDLLLARSGIYFSDHRQGDLYHSLSMILSATGHASLETLYAAASSDERVLHAVIEGVTVGETYFFRNAAQFAALRDSILPDLIARRAAIRSLRFWSAGCATGEEPYSLAILLREVLPDPASWQVTILATDINTTFLERARAGVYGAWSFRETDVSVRDRYFERVGEARWRIRPDLRRQVLFTRLNLVEDEYPAVMNGTAMQDVILCRNVLIYFDDNTIRAVVRRLYRALIPGGWLIVGHAEARSDFFDDFEVVNFPGTVMYRKPLTAPLFDEMVALPQAPGRQWESDPPCSDASTPHADTPPLLLTDPAATLSASPPDASERETNASDDVPDLYAAARRAADRGDLETALRLCATVTEQQPLRAEAHLLTGQIMEQRGRLEEALAAYRRALYLDHTLYFASLAMAGILHRTGRSADARRVYQRLLRALAALPPNAPVPSLEEATAAELQAFLQRQLAALNAPASSGSFLERPS
ncbi:MAG: CheR family methyltransferase [Roseiflexaceae bacterium]|nr:CheR family methyltransferase [Roseiflexaceae bacterium]